MTQYVYVHVNHGHLITEALCIVTCFKQLLQWIDGLYSISLLLLG